VESANYEVVIKMIFQVLTWAFALGLPRERVVIHKGLLVAPLASLQDWEPS
jgi:hypothetical protein